MNVAVLRSWIYSLRYRGVQIGQGCFIRKDSVIDTDVEIGNGTGINGARIFSKSKIGTGCRFEPGSQVGATVFGDKSIVEAGAKVFNSEIEGRSAILEDSIIDRLSLGAYSYIAREVILNDVSIGRFSSVGPRSIIGTGEHPVDFASTSPVFYSTRRQCGVTFASTNGFVERRRVQIGHDVWIGAQVFIRDGITIGNGAIIAAGAIVTKDVPAYAIAGGVPAKLIRPRFAPDLSTRLDALKWWDWDAEKLSQAQPYIAQNDPEKFLVWATSNRAP